MTEHNPKTTPRPDVHTQGHSPYSDDIHRDPTAARAPLPPSQAGTTTTNPVSRSDANKTRVAGTANHVRSPWKQYLVGVLVALAACALALWAFGAFDLTETEVENDPPAPMLHEVVPNEAVEATGDLADE